jgi:hypothetical protein
MVDMRVPDFVIAGAARAGSTAVVESLRRRADVFVTQPKEPHFLALADIGPTFTGPADDMTINKVLVADEAAYRSLFADAPEDVLRGEGSVSTLYYYEQAAGRLVDLNPEARVVIVLRDPVERAHSSHQYLVNRGHETVLDLVEAIELEEERRAAGWHHLWHYTGMSRYADAVEQFVKVFPTGAVGVWWYDDLIADEERTLGEIHQFLGLGRQAGVLSAGRVNASGTPRRRWLYHGMQLASRSTSLRRAVKAVVPFEARERIRTSNLVAAGAPPDVRQRLRPLFDDDLARLAEVLGRPVPESWRR